MDVPLDVVLSAIGALGIVATVVLMWLELRHGRRVSTAGFTLTLCYDIFHSESMIEQRRRLAELLQSPVMDEAVFERIDREAREPLDFMEDVGELLRSKVVLKEFIYSSLSYWILNYWLLAEGYVKWARRTNPLFYDNFEHLFNEMLKIEAKRRNKAPQEVLKELRRSVELGYFIESEKNLPVLGK
jgi:hypothetical protein